MAKRRRKRRQSVYEFKPDPKGTNFFKRLYLTKVQQMRLLKWGLISAVLVVLSLIQDVVLPQSTLHGAPLCLVPCGILLCGMFFDPEKTGIFTLISSTLYYFSGTADGVYSILLLTGLGTLLCIFRTGYLQRRFGALLMCAAAGMFAYEMMVFGVGIFFGNTTWQRFSVFAICGGLSIAVMPVLYPVFSSISKIGGETWKE